MNATWLFAEAYKYRRLRECFTVSRHWHDYDVFFRQKVSFWPVYALLHGYKRYYRHVLPIRSHFTTVRYLFAFYGRRV